MIFGNKADKEQWLYHLTVVSGGDPKAGTQFEQLIQKLMEDEADNVEKFEIDQKVKNFYSTCIDVAQREKDGVKPILEILDGIGGWPVLESNCM